MPAIRKIRKVLKGKPTIEGAGVHLKRVFGFSEVPLFDPFLLLDDFRSDNPDHYIKGFPWHPHRGIETITYVLNGDVEHGDSLGNKGIISSGDVQWMTAGSGIIHQEMPKGDRNGKMYGFQLWANLPSREKMMDPRYRDVANEQIPEVKLPNDTTIKIISGEVAGIKGPVQDIVIDPEYIDVTVPANSEYRHPTKQGHKEMLEAIELYLRYFRKKSPDIFVFGHTHRAAKAYTDAFRRESDKPLTSKVIEVWNDGSFIEDRKAKRAGSFLITDDDPMSGGLIKLYQVDLRGNVQEKNI